jgi:Asp-tRNA(Asn)/Glu-tRNA(Gln) amidotransferase C subunit
MIPSLRHLPYKQHINHLNLSTLEERRRRADLLEIFKMYKEYTNFNLRNLFEPNQNTITRGHSIRFIKPRARLDVRKYLVNNRTINDWNRLTQEAVHTLLSFKQNLEKRLNKPYTTP